MPNVLAINSKCTLFSSAIRKSLIPGGIFWQLFCKKKIYVSVCVRVEVKLLLTAEKKIYARGDNWFPMISGNGI